MIDKPSICVDLDGVLADYSKGWQGMEAIGDPIHGAVEFTHELGKIGKVVIFTTRCSASIDTPDREELRRQNDSLIDEQIAYDVLVPIVKTWLDKHKFYYDEIYIGQGKPIASAYIDDRAVVCRPQRHYLPKTSNELAEIEFEVALMRTRELLQH